MIPFLTVRAPWAHSIFLPDAPYGVVDLRHRKTVENRSWKPRLEGRIVIHVGRQIDRDGLEFLDRDLTDDERRDLGMVIGTVQVLGSHLAGSYACIDQGCHANPWCFWPTVTTPRIHHWQLGNPRRLITPFEAIGRQQFWAGNPTEVGRVLDGEYR